jgi:hypothetical protein
MEKGGFADEDNDKWAAMIKGFLEDSKYFSE